VLGMLFMTLKDLQAGLQKALQLGIGRRWNERGFERAVDRLVVGYLVVDIGLVKRRTVQLGELGTLGIGVLGQRLAGVVVFRLDLELGAEIKRLLVDRLVVSQHVFGKRFDILVLGPVDRLLGRSNV